MRLDQNGIRDIINYLEADKTQLVPFVICLALWIYAAVGFGASLFNKGKASTPKPSCDARGRTRILKSAVRVVIVVIAVIVYTEYWHLMVSGSKALVYVAFSYFMLIGVVALMWLIVHIVDKRRQGS
jgi:hypothetical protein